MFLERGFQNVKFLEGGFTAWQEEGYPVVPISNQESGHTSSLTYQPRLGLSVGDSAVDISLKDITGVEYTLSQLYTEKPLIIEFGSYTTPSFRQQVADTELLIEKYHNQAQFVIVYGIESCPFGSKSPYYDTEWTNIYSYDTEDNPITQAQTYSERVSLASLCVEDTGITALVMVDTMDNVLWQTYGPAPNMAYLIGTDGEIIATQLWYNADLMESAIISYLQNTRVPLATGSE